MFRDCLVLVACFLPLGCSSSSTPPTATQPSATAARDTAAPDTAPPGEASGDAAHSADDPTATASPADSDDSSAAATTPSEAAANDPSPTEPTAVASARPSTDQPAPADAAKQKEPSDAAPDNSPAGGYHEPAALDVYPTADFTVTSDEFYAEHAADEDAWKQKYAGKVVEVRGQVDSYTGTVGGIGSAGMSVTFETSDVDFWSADLRHDRPWLDHPPGSTLVIRGKVNNDFPSLGAAYIVSSEPGPALLELTPAELHERYRADQLAFADEYGRQYLSIKGIVSGRHPSAYGQVLTLGGDGSELIELSLLDYQARCLSHWQPGDEVHLLATYDSTGSDERPAFLNVLPVHPLNDYPPLPPLELREINGAQVPIRAFTAELLGRWLQENERALLWMLEADSKDAQIAVQGQVQSVEKAEAFFGEEVEVRLQDGYGGLLRFNLDKPVAEKLGVKPGASMTVRGRPFGETQGMTFLAPEVEMEMEME
jgi:hypothetical protein